MQLPIKLAAIAFYGMPNDREVVSVGESIYTFWEDGMTPEPEGNVVNLVSHPDPTSLMAYLAERIEEDYASTECRATAKNGILILASHKDVAVTTNVEKCVIADFDS